MLALTYLKKYMKETTKLKFAEAECTIKNANGCASMWKAGSYREAMCVLPLHFRENIVSAQHSRQHCIAKELDRKSGRRFCS